MGLVLNIFSNYIGGEFISHTANEISVVPKFTRPKLFPQLRVFLKYFSCRYTFHYPNYIRRRILRRYFEKYVYMVYHNFHCIYIKFIFFSNSLEYFFYVIGNFLIQHLFPVFRNPNHVIFKVVNGMLRSFYSHVVFISSIEPFGNYYLPRRQTAFIPPAS